MSKILVIGGYPNSLINFRGHLLKELTLRGHEVIGCAGGDDFDVAMQIESIGAKYISAPFLRASLNPIRDAYFFYSLIKIMLIIKPDVVLAYTIKPVIYGLIAARITGVRRRFALITGLGYAFINKLSLKDLSLNYLICFLYKIALCRATGVFFQNNDDMKLFYDEVILKPDIFTKCINGSGVDINYYAFSSLPSEPFVFLLMARMLYDKGIREFVEAARIIRSKNNRVIFALLGPFDINPASIMREELDKWICDGVIEYWGEAKDVRELLCKCSVFVLPSYREGLPRGVLEAMSIGRPIITTNVPGCRETVIENINGFLVKSKDITSLVHAMEKCLVSHERLREMGIASRRIVESRFDVKIINKKLINFMSL